MLFIVYVCRPFIRPFNFISENPASVYDKAVIGRPQASDLFGANNEIVTDQPEASLSYSFLIGLNVRPPSILKSLSMYVV